MKFTAEYCLSFPGDSHECSIVRYSAIFAAINIYELVIALVVFVICSYVLVKRKHDLSGSLLAHRWFHLQRYFKFRRKDVRTVILVVTSALRIVVSSYKAIQQISVLGNSRFVAIVHGVEICITIGAQQSWLMLLMMDTCSTMLSGDAARSYQRVRKLVIWSGVAITFCIAAPFFFYGSVDPIIPSYGFICAMALAGIRDLYLFNSVYHRISKITGDVVSNTMDDHVQAAFAELRGAAHGTRIGATLLLTFKAVIIAVPTLRNDYAYVYFLLQFLAVHTGTLIYAKSCLQSLRRQQAACLPIDSQTTHSPTREWKTTHMTTRLGSASP